MYTPFKVPLEGALALLVAADQETDSCCLAYKILELDMIETSEQFYWRLSLRKQTFLINIDSESEMYVRQAREQKLVLVTTSKLVYWRISLR